MITTSYTSNTPDSGSRSRMRPPSEGKHPASFFHGVSQEGAGEKKALNSYYEKTIGNVRYRVYSVFAQEGDFQSISESLLVSRVLKHLGKGCDQTQPDDDGKEV